LRWSTRRPVEDSWRARGSTNPAHITSVSENFKSGKFRRTRPKNSSVQSVHVLSTSPSCSTLGGVVGETTRRRTTRVGGTGRSCFRRPPRHSGYQCLVWIIGSSAPRFSEKVHGMAALVGKALDLSGARGRRNSGRFPQGRTAPGRRAAPFVECVVIGLDHHQVDVRSGPWVRDPAPKKPGQGGIELRPAPAGGQSRTSFVELSSRDASRRSWSGDVVTYRGA